MNDWLTAPWLRNQMNHHLADLRVWLRQGYVLTEEQQAELDTIINLARENHDSQSLQEPVRGPDSGSQERVERETRELHNQQSDRESG